ncbi:hypothetical protein T492DRAFT_21327 [Pavlovales sp. CCMP2436]|nr:hypothetical protein T492DRAFT_21327 [Pavlovales sp. CCMP2436]
MILNSSAITSCRCSSRQAIAALCCSLSPTFAGIVRSRVAIAAFGFGALAAGTLLYHQDMLILFDVDSYTDASRSALFAVERMYSTCRVAIVVLIPPSLIGRMVVKWRHPRALVAAMFTAAGLLFVCHGLLDGVLFSLLAFRRGDPQWLLAGILVCALVTIALGAALLTPNALLHGRALIVSFKRVVPCLRGREEAVGGSASLAPLLGYGTLRERDPRELVQEAACAFVPIVASAQSLRALCPTALFGSAEAESNVSTPHLAQIHVDVASQRPSAASRTTLRAPRYSEDGVEPPMASAEYYVVHGRYDDPQAKLDALASWVSNIESAHGGRSPSIYIGGVYAGISPVELLEHMPVYIARSKRLLILAGPGLPAQLWCAMECYTWFALGGRIEDVEVAIVASDAANAGAAVSAFDAFHVMYSLSGGESCTRRRLMAAVELAGIRRFNGTLRKLMPRVKDAADRQQVARLNV